MRRNILLPLLLAPVFLASCQGPRPMIGTAYVGGVPSPGHVVLQGNYEAIVFQTEPAAEATRSQISKVQFIVGTKTFVAKSADATRPNSYVWTSTNPCEELPQGDKLPLKYEMLDTNNKVLQEAATTVDIHTCR